MSAAAYPTHSNENVPAPVSQSAQRALPVQRAAGAQVCPAGILAEGRGLSSIKSIPAL